MADAFAPNLLAGKHALVTGGGSGINLAIARRYAAAGATASLIGRTKEKLDAAANEIRKAGGTAAGYPCDVRDYDALAAAIAAARAASGEIDLVVCGAAGNFPAPALGMSANGFKAVIDIDLPRPRAPLRSAPEVARIVDQLWSVIRDEAAMAIAEEGN